MAGQINPDPICFPVFTSLDLDQVAGVSVVGNSNKGLLDGPGRGEPVKDGHGTTLVVGSGSPGTSERLLSNNGTGTLVVDVVVTGSVPELVGSQDHGRSVLREDRTGKTVFGGRVDQLAGLGELFVVVDVTGENGSKDLLGHGDRLGVLGKDDGGLDKESLRVVP